MTNPQVPCQCQQAAATHRTTEAALKQQAQVHEIAAATLRQQAEEHRTNAEQIEQNLSRAHLYAPAASFGYGRDFPRFVASFAGATDPSDVGSVQDTVGDYIGIGDCFFRRGDVLIDTSPELATQHYQMAEWCYKMPAAHQASGVAVDFRLDQFKAAVDSGMFPKDTLVAAPVCLSCPRANTTCSGCSKGPAVTNDGGARCSNCTKA